MHVTIVGAGLMGRLIGWRLSERGARVTLFERDPAAAPTSAGNVAAGMLAPHAELPEAAPGVAALARDSLPLWREWLDVLDVPWALDGSLVVAHARDQALLAQFERALEPQAPGEAQRVEIAAYEPELADRFRNGLFLAPAGWIDNRALLDALGRRCGDIHFETQMQPEAVTGDAVIDCRGAWGDEAGLRAVRGEAVRVHAPEVALSRPVRLMHPRYRLYVAPRTNSTYVIGATQIESDDTGPVRVRSALELLSAAFTLHPGFAEARIIELGTGLRPAFPDNAPRVVWRDNVLRVNGLYRHGYLIGPAVAEQALREIDRVWKSS